MARSSDVPPQTLSQPIHELTLDSRGVLAVINHSEPRYGSAVCRRYGLPVLAFLTVAFLSTKLLLGNNLDFHLHGGRWIVEHFAVPQTDIATYSVPDNPYVDLHWLFQVGLFLVWKLGGFAGISVVNTLLALLLFGLLYLRNESLGVNRDITSWCLLAAIVAIHQRLQMRPESLTFIYLVAVGLLLDAWESHRWRAIIVLPVIQVLWVNTQGLFMLGWFIIVANFVGRTWSNRRMDWPLFLTLLVSMSVSLLNPYGWRAVVFAVHLLTRFNPGNVFREQYLECAPLWQLVWHLEEYVFLAYAGLTLVCLALTFRRSKLTDWILILPVFALALIAVRNVPLFVLVAMPILGRSLSELRAQTSSFRASAQWPRVLSVLSPVLFVVFCLSIVLRVVSGAYYGKADKNLQFKFGLGLDTGARPVAAASFIMRCGLGGRILNDSSIGGWLSWSLRRPVYLDQRSEVITEELYVEERNSYQAGGLRVLMAKYRPEIVIFDYVREGGKWLPQLAVDPEWKLVFADAAACVFVPTAESRVPALDLHRLAVETCGSGSVDDDVDGRIMSTPLRPGWVRWALGFVVPFRRDQSWPEWGWLCERLGHLDEAEIFYWACLREDRETYADVFNDLGAVLLKTGRYAKAELAYTRFLEYTRTAKALNDRGLSRLAQGATARALEDFNAGLELEPRSEMLRMNRAWARFSAGDRQGAAEDYRMVIEANPANDKVRELLHRMQFGP